MSKTNNSPFASLIDLASEDLGGKALSASDEFFAEKENLLKPGRGVFIEDKYTDRGKWMDGWETRRSRRTSGCDWCLIQLGIPGNILGVDIDTNHFLGNHPPFAELNACSTTEAPTDKTKWTTLVPHSAIASGSQNLFTVSKEAPPAGWTHVRLKIYPDGGVARLRIYGDVVPQWTQTDNEARVDLVAIQNGGKSMTCSDMFFSTMNNLLKPGKSKDMGDGWETRRKRGPGNDWVILKLGATGVVGKIEVDTDHFKGNFPEKCSLEGCYLPGATCEALMHKKCEWREILKPVSLNADTQHFFEKEIKKTDPITHVRLNIFPDGGIARLRLWGNRKEA